MSEAGRQPTSAAERPGDVLRLPPAGTVDRAPMPEPSDPGLPSSLPSGHRDPVEGHERFATGEIAIVCSHYELGLLRRVTEFRRGSRRAPKVVLESSRGRLLLKRRAIGRNGAQSVAFAHAVQTHLSRRGFPLARLLPTRDGRTSVAVGGAVYELFEFVDGVRYDRSERATLDAGRTLAELHRLAAGHPSDGAPAAGGYHESPIVLDALAELPGLGNASIPAGLCAGLTALYEHAAGRARAMGFSAWPRQVVHGDYHPGNIVFSAGPGSDEDSSRVRAVLDYDACRLGPRALDLANGALQFSVTRLGLQPASWPVALDRTRLWAFLTGYDSVPGCIISKAELAALPWLMIEALIAEATVPIRATGRFGQLDAAEFLAMVDRKANWIAQHHEEVSQL